MRTLRDDCHRKLQLAGPIQRIVCLCPSLTETLFALGVGDQVVGRTRYCIHPQPDIEAVATVGGTKNPALDDIVALAPDLVIAEKEENRKQDVDELQAHCPVYVCNIESFDDALASILRLGCLLQREALADELHQRISTAWQQLPTMPRPLRVLYLIWRRPWMAAGAGTYIDAVLARCGLINVAREFEGRYPQLSVEQLAGLDCDVCLLSSEPYPFKPKHQAEVGKLMPGVQTQRVDGEMFSWYGARMLPAADYLSRSLQAWQAEALG